MYLDGNFTDRHVTGSGDSRFPSEPGHIGSVSSFFFDRIFHNDQPEARQIVLICVCVCVCARSASN